MMMFREPHSQHDLFDRLPATKYLSQLPVKVEETVRIIGYDVLFIPAPFGSFTKYILAYLRSDSVSSDSEGRRIEQFTHTVDRADAYWRITITNEGGRTYLIVFRHIHDPAASVVLVCSEIVIEWCELVERIYHMWVKFGSE